MEQPSIHIVTKTSYTTITPTSLPSTHSHLSTFSKSTTTSITFRLLSSSSPLPTSTPPPALSSSSSIPSPTISAIPLPNQKYNNAFPVFIVMALALIAAFCLALIGYIIYLNFRGQCPGCADAKAQLRKWEAGELKRITPEMVEHRQEAYAALHGDRGLDLENGGRRGGDDDDDDDVDDAEESGAIKSKKENGLLKVLRRALKHFGHSNHPNVSSTMDTSRSRPATTPPPPPPPPTHPPALPPRPVDAGADDDDDGAPVEMEMLDCTGRRSVPYFTFTEHFQPTPTKYFPNIHSPAVYPPSIVPSSMYSSSVSAPNHPARGPVDSSPGFTDHHSTYSLYAPPSPPRRCPPSTRENQLADYSAQSQEEFEDVDLSDESQMPRKPSAAATMRSYQIPEWRKYQRIQGGF